MLFIVLLTIVWTRQFSLFVLNEQLDEINIEIEIETSMASHFPCYGLKPSKSHKGQIRIVISVLSLN